MLNLYENDYSAYIMHKNHMKFQIGKEKAYDKAVKMIKSSKTNSHFKACKKYIELFTEKYGKNNMLDVMLIGKIKGFI